MPVVAATASALQAKPNVAEQFTFAYLTDIHVQPELGADRGLAQCLQKVNALEQSQTLCLRVAT